MMKEKDFGIDRKETSLLYLYYAAWKQFPISNISTIVESTMKYIDYSDSRINLTISVGCFL